MDPNEKLIHKLNELIEVNNDRIEGYEKAKKEIRDIELKDLFQKMSNHSRELKTELAVEIKKLGGVPTSSASSSGKIFRVWMDIKASLTGHDLHAILGACRTGEDSALAVYENALATENTFSARVKEIIEKQKQELTNDFNQLKKIASKHRGAKNTISSSASRTLSWRQKEEKNAS